MLWLVPAVFACFAAAVFLWSRGLRLPAALLGLASLGFLFFVGRGLESSRDAQWQEAAERLQASFRRDRHAQRWSVSERLRRGASGHATENFSVRVPSRATMRAFRGRSCRAGTPSASDVARSTRTPGTR